jgi:hypothetical protein
MSHMPTSVNLYSGWVGGWVGAGLTFRFAFTGSKMGTRLPYQVVTPRLVGLSPVDFCRRTKKMMKPSALPVRARSRGETDAAKNSPEWR